MKAKSQLGSTHEIKGMRLWTLVVRGRDGAKEVANGQRGGGSC